MPFQPSANRPPIVNEPLSARCESAGDGGRQTVEVSQQLGAEALEVGALGGGNRIAASISKRDAGVALLPIDEHLEVKMRSRRQPCHTDVRHRLADRYPRADMDPIRKPAEMSVARNESVSVTDLEHVSIPASPSRPLYDAVTDRPHRCTSGGSVVGALVLLPDTEDRMKSIPKGARDAAELKRCSEEGRSERLAGLVEV